MFRKTAVTDTNVVLSSFLAPGSTTAQALVALSSRRQLICNSETLDELRMVWLRAKFDRYATLAARTRLLSVFESRLTSVPSTTQIRVCRDPRDDKFLELAVSGGADLILTGDADLLTLHPFRGIAVLTPAAYLASLREGV